MKEFYINSKNDVFYFLKKDPNFTKHFRAMSSISLHTCILFYSIRNDNVMPHFTSTSSLNMRDRIRRLRFQVSCQHNFSDLLTLYMRT